ncbi:PhzF family phenazine biosynthesis protein OS=Streptomyces microflavus OX=1919 GN=HUT09_08845 PE=4 SV=1 [Streptomyces microflavus]
MDIHTPGLRLPFAGHPLVGAAWLLDLEILELPVGDVFARQDGEFTWITARPDVGPAAHAPAVRDGRRGGGAAGTAALGWPAYAWAWEDEAAGRVRARAFPRRGEGIVEDEATGAAAMLLSARLGRALNIAQGRGSQILTAPAPDGTVEVGGRVLMAARG